MMVITLSLELGDIENVFETKWSFSTNQELIDKFGMAGLSLTK